MFANGRLWWGGSSDTGLIQGVLWNTGIDRKESDWWRVVWLHTVCDLLKEWESWQVKIFTHIRFSRR